MNFYADDLEAKLNRAAHVRTLENSVTTHITCTEKREGISFHHMVFLTTNIDYLYGFFFFH